MSILVQSLTVYPVKSCRGVELPSSRVDRRGLVHDRRWMVVDEHGQFLSQRRIPELCQVSTSLSEAHILLEADGVTPLELPLALSVGPRQVVSVFESSLEALEYSPASVWFTQVLGRPCRAVHLPESSVRPVSLRYAEPGDQLSFADAFPCLLLSEASLAELNRRCPEPMSLARFRPNIVLGGGAPHFEDDLVRFAIGELPFRAPKLCDRCSVTLIDPVTGASGLEPLATLARYRRWEGKVWFGVNVVPEQLGAIKVGDLLRELPISSASR